MPQSLAALERQRAAILSEILHLGDFRSGSITATRGRCGKPNCRCHQPDQPPHGPHFRLTKKVSGKTVTETFSSPADRRKAERQVAEFHRFQQLSSGNCSMSTKAFAVCDPPKTPRRPRKKNGRNHPPRSSPKK